MQDVAATHTKLAPELWAFWGWYVTFNLSLWNICLYLHLVFTIIKLHCRDNFFYFACIDCSHSADCPPVLGDTGIGPV